MATCVAHSIVYIASLGYSALRNVWDKDLLRHDLPPISHNFRFGITN